MQGTLVGRGIALICIGVLSFFGNTTSHGQSNIVLNGSFEQLSLNWSATGGLGLQPQSAAADGQVFAMVLDSLWQDLNTVPDRDYVVMYALNRNSSEPLVTWGESQLGPFTNVLGDAFWQYRYVYVHAESNLTRLRFQGSSRIDDVRVGWLQEPIQIRSQPQSRTAFEGASVSFTVTAQGAPPLQYQWLFDGSPILGATNSALLLSQIRSNQAGQISVIVSNISGSVLSQTVDLQVTTPPSSPEIVVQPVGDICPKGYGCTLTAYAVGAPPLSYQWSVGGTAIPAGTNATFRFESVDLTNAGTYSVTVSNAYGTVQSLSAEIVVTNTTAGGVVVFDTGTNNAPIFDIDGFTRLAGSNFVAQVYAGPNPGILRPVGAKYYFPIGMYAGYMRGISRPIPDLPNGSTAYIQVRAWETAAGSTYEEARWSGGKFGFSSVLPSVIGTFTRVPMRSFSLRAGEPFFITGRLGFGEQLPDGTRPIALTGEVGARYLIEKKILPNNWVPFLTVTNFSGTTIFSDPAQQQQAVQFYRARILD